MKIYEIVLIGTLDPFVCSSYMIDPAPFACASSYMIEDVFSSRLPSVEAGFVVMSDTTGLVCAASSSDTYVQN